MVCGLTICARTSNIETYAFSSNESSGNFEQVLFIVCADAILKGSICLLWDITTEKSGLCQYAVCTTQNIYIQK